MSERFWLAVGWAFCVFMGVCVRLVLSSALGIWSSTGSMTVAPWVFIIVDGVPILVAGVIFVYMFCCPDDHVLRLRKVKQT